jgi:hypothetical protein
MSIEVEQRPCDTSAFAYLDQSPFALADDARKYSASATARPAGRGWDQLIAELLRIYRLEDDWDGEGSMVPAPGVVVAAAILASTWQKEEFLPADRVTASVNGTIYFEWYIPDGYLEIEVTSPFDAERRWVARGATTAEVARLPIP